MTEKLRKKLYAGLIAQKGINVKNGQHVIIRAELDQPDFITMLTEACYKAGAGSVSVEWEHQPLTVLHTKYKSEDELSSTKDWEIDKYRYESETLPAIIYIISEDPDGLANIDGPKYSKASQKRRQVKKPFRDMSENKYQWCIAAVPGKKWSHKVFSDIPTGMAVKKMWNLIMDISRVTDNPSAEWDMHNSKIHKRCDKLNSLKLDRLEYHSNNGTNITIGLINDSSFQGGSSYTIDGTEYNPNIPSEEIFISPKKGRADGVVHITKPLSYKGRLIKEFSLVFKDGKAIEIHASDKDDESILKTMLNMDEGASFLGECALVPFDSPIQQSGVLFYETLFDENASCHLAVGVGFPECINGYENHTLEECRKLGINDSIIHQDFMIGTEDLNIIGYTEKNEPFEIFRNGKWAFEV